jgi:hypothetical protein
MNEIRFADYYDYLHPNRHIRGHTSCPKCIGGTVSGQCKCGGFIHVACIKTDTDITGITFILQARCDKCNNEFPQDK